MKAIDADKFLAYLIISKHIDELSCGEVKQAIEMCKVDVDVDDVLDKIKTEIGQITDTMGVSYNPYISKIDVLQIIDKYKSKQHD